MPGLPVHHQLPEFTQTHFHQVGDAIQPLSKFLLTKAALSARVGAGEERGCLRWGAGFSKRKLKGQGSKENPDSTASSPLNEQNLYCFTSVFKGDKLAQRLKRLPPMRETRVRSLEKEMAIHSSILTWRIPWME